MTLTASLDARREIVHAYLSAGRDCSPPVIAERTGWSREAVSEVLAAYRAEAADDRRDRLTAYADEIASADPYAAQIIRLFIDTPSMPLSEIAQLVDVTADYAYAVLLDAHAVTDPLRPHTASDAPAGALAPGRRPGPAEPRGTSSLVPPASVPVAV